MSPINDGELFGKDYQRDTSIKMASATRASFPYSEPTISTLLIFASFLILLNTLNSLLNSTIYCGLIAQLLLGIAYGTPGANWLSTTTETTISNLGYIGLILIVYEGGLSTSLPSLRANIGLASGVAVTGIATPIALSFVLKALVGATDLQAFAAGAALCSTSLGTTFAVLQSTGLDSTRLGVVLTTAAMMDDVVGLVMVEVIANLGGEEAFRVATVLRPVGVSVAFVVVVPLACWVVNRVGVVSWGLHMEQEKRRMWAWAVLDKIEVVIVIHCLFLLAMVAAGSYAGTSNLFTAYLAGIIINWWDSTRVNLRAETSNSKQAETISSNVSKLDSSKHNIEARGLVNDQTDAKSSHPTSNQANTSMSRVPSSTPKRSTSNAGAKISSQSQLDLNPTGLTGLATYHRYLSQPVERILKPFFFASIGFSIPISQMFNGGVLWRGIVYTILMLVAKLVCGVWLLRFRVLGTKFFNRVVNVAGGRSQLNISEKKIDAKNKQQQHTSKAGDTEDDTQTVGTEMSSIKPAQYQQQQLLDAQQQPHSHSTAATTAQPPADPPLSVYPSLILGSAMVARGEIGFLISALAESRGIFTTTTVEWDSTRDSSQDIFLIVTWAIMLCTIIGPVSVGLFVRRVRRLEKRKDGGGEKDVLGVWGVD